VKLSQEGTTINPEIIRYLNRLSSLLFIAARSEDLRDNSAVRLAKSSSGT
jgi:cob(I)alamin adenosyltransferase